MRCVLHSDHEYNERHTRSFIYTDTKQASGTFPFQYWVGFKAGIRHVYFCVGLLCFHLLLRCSVSSSVCAYRCLGTPRCVARCVLRVLHWGVHR
jgi:hypothetical protein